MSTPVETALRARFDQQRQAIFAMQAAWPHNGHLYNHAKADAAIFDRLRGGWQNLTPGQCYVLWGDGRAVAAEPHPEMLRDVITSSAPRLAVTACDICGEVGAAGVAPVATPPYIVGLVLCGPCASYLNPDPFLTPDQGDN